RPAPERTTPVHARPPTALTAPLHVRTATVKLPPGRRDGATGPPCRDPAVPARGRPREAAPVPPPLRMRRTTHDPAHLTHHERHPRREALGPRADLGQHRPLRWQDPPRQGRARPLVAVP